MRKAVSIFFLCLFLLYHVGYLGYYWFSTKQINEQWMGHIEITPNMKHVAIPISLPYWNSQSEYRAAHGKIIINGELYRKVMQKYDNDEIHLIVAKDLATQQLNQTISDWVQSMTDGENPEDTGDSNLLKSVIKDYIPRRTKAISFSKWWISKQKADFSCYGNVLYFNNFQEISTPPPKA